MKKLLLTTSILLLAAACNKPQVQPAQNQQNQVAQPSLSIVYPAGGENFNVNSAIGIKYIVNSNFASQLTSRDTTELYLLDKNGVVVGFIGTISPSQQVYNWKPTDLGHWAGLDIILRAPETGTYKILLVSRKKAEPKNPQGDYPVDIFVDGQNDSSVQTKFDGTKISYTTNGKTTYPYEVLAAAAGNIFTLTNSPKPSLKLYNNTKYNFQLSYPNSWILSENDSYISLKPFANSKSNFTINTVNVGRETVFDLGSKVKLQDTTFAGEKAKIYSCQQEGNICPNQLDASIAIHLLGFPAGWGQWNEIDYEVYKSDKVNTQDFQQILNSFKFTK